MAKLQRYIQTVSLICIAIAVAGLVGVALVQYVQTQTGSYRYAEVGQLPQERVGIVFGAGLSRDGQLSSVLRDRVEMGIQLYNEKKVEKLLMSGDNRRLDYNEVVAMQRYALQRGVPEEDITLDYAGLSTYDTCYRAKAIFGVERAILITQRYHIPRAVYSCRQLGIEAVGIEIPDWERYPSLRERSLLREELATVNMLWEIHVSKPKPILGKYEGIQ